MKPMTMNTLMSIRNHCQGEIEWAHYYSDKKNGRRPSTQCAVGSIAYREFVRWRNALDDAMHHISNSLFDRTDPSNTQEAQ